MSVIAFKFFTATIPDGKQYRVLGKSKKSVAKLLGIDPARIDRGAYSVLPNISEYFMRGGRDGKTGRI